MSFTLDSFFNPHLVPGTSRIDAVLSVIHAQEEPTVVGSKLAYVFAVDVSGSMENNDKLVRAKLALRRAIAALPPTAFFAVIAFNDRARVLVAMTQANAIAKSAADHAVQVLRAENGTVMSLALREIKAQFASMPDAIKLAQFLTDGENAREDQAALERALADCRGSFQCDCRGIGTDWHPDQLRLIANALLGTADAVCDGEALDADLKSMIDRALGKGLANAVLRLWSPKSARLLAVKQVMPEIVDLTAMGHRLDDKTLDFPLGAWGAETREYHVSIEVPAGSEGDEILVCRPSIVFEANGAEVKVAGANIVAAWTANEALTTRINAQVAHYTGQTELADSIKEGLEAKARGDVDQATRLLGKAVKIAASSGNDEVTRRLRKVVDVVDADAGTVRIKSSAGRAAELELDMGGTRTVRRRAPTATAGSTTPGQPS